MKQRAIVYCRISNVSQTREEDGCCPKKPLTALSADAKDHDVVTVFPDTAKGGGGVMDRCALGVTYVAIKGRARCPCLN